MACVDIGQKADRESRLRWMTRQPPIRRVVVMRFIEISQAVGLGVAILMAAVVLFGPAFVALLESMPRRSR